jgi:hypothetical protein
MSAGNPMQQWELVAERGAGDSTERLRIPGGWLYRTILTPGSESAPESVALVFVPEVS